jgi:outer membrane protein OmpA-like peptidoglycan-associated protein
VLFAVNQASLTTNAQSKIKDLGDILKKYPDTYVLIEGHTDASGTDKHNMQLSQRRAESVAAFLSGNNIATNRLKTAWYGESQPKVGNDTEENKAKNRRVEFAIYANEQMKEKAQSQSTGQ